MNRPVTLFTGQWADLPIEELVATCAGWGFDGLELACWGDHFEVDKAIADPAYAKGRRAMLEGHGLDVWAIGAHLVGNAETRLAIASHGKLVAAHHPVLDEIGEGFVVVDEKDLSELGHHITSRRR